ncbi:hypothetical protein [Alkalilacustris brevis]|uniref:hypothetical protein n=1 Tax=Alkalilacustris brevis TaxID=2026338 RepID=UPI0012D2AFEA|nr:hypothetical protein [Alkalilacustris brevis]
MSIARRVRAVMGLAGVFYFAIIALGMGSGFSTTLWLVAMLLFFLWHLLMHDTTQKVSWFAVIGVHALISGLCLLIGHGLGVLFGSNFGPEVPLVMAVVAMGFARYLNPTPEETAELQRITQELQEANDKAARAAQEAARLDAEELEGVVEAIGTLPAEGAEARHLNPLLRRLNKLGRPAAVLKQLADTDDAHLPYVQAHVTFALSPGPADETLGRELAREGMLRALDSGVPGIVEGAIKAAYELLAKVPHAAPDLPEPDELDEYAGKFEADGKAEVAQGLRRLAEYLRRDPDEGAGGDG